MTSIPWLASHVQTLLTSTADRLARETGFVQRSRKLHGSVLAQTLVFGLLATSSATLRQFQQMAATVGVSVSPQALSQRCSEGAASFLRALLEEAVQTVVRGRAAALPLLERFPMVRVLDSTVIVLPPAVRTVWRGCGGSTPTAAAAALKVQCSFELCRGSFEAIELCDGASSDQRAGGQTAPLPPGGLRLADLGFFSIPVFRQVVADDAHFLTRALPLLTVRCGTEPRQRLPRFLAQRGAVVDEQVIVGGTETLACRLIAVRVPDRIAEQRRAKEQHEAQRAGRAPREAVLRLSWWTVLLTSLPPDQLTVAEALVLARLRWQVELLFKRWKSDGLAVDRWRSADPWRALCTVYASLLAAVVAQWLTAVLCWEVPDKSLHGALVGIRAWAQTLLYALHRSQRRLIETLRSMRAALPATIHLHKRRSRPASFQLLRNPALQPLN